MISFNGLLVAHSSRSPHGLILPMLHRARFLSALERIVRPTRNRSDLGLAHLVLIGLDIELPPLNSSSKACLETTRLRQLFRLRSISVILPLRAIPRRLQAGPSTRLSAPHCCIFYLLLVEIILTNVFSPFTFGFGGLSSSDLVADWSCYHPSGAYYFVIWLQHDYLKFAFFVPFHNAYPYSINS